MSKELWPSHTRVVVSFRNLWVVPDHVFVAIEFAIQRDYFGLNLRWGFLNFMLTMHIRPKATLTTRSALRWMFRPRKKVGVFHG